MPSAVTISSMVLVCVTAVGFRACGVPGLKLRDGIRSLSDLQAIRKQPSKRALSGGELHLHKLRYRQPEHRGRKQQ